MILIVFQTNKFSWNKVGIPKYDIPLKKCLIKFWLGQKLPFESRKKFCFSKYCYLMMLLEDTLRQNVPMFWGKKNMEFVSLLCVVCPILSAIGLSGSPFHSGTIRKVIRGRKHLPDNVTMKEPLHCWVGFPSSLLSGSRRPIIPPTPHLGYIMSVLVLP